MKEIEAKDKKVKGFFLDNTLKKIGFIYVPVLAIYLLSIYKKDLLFIDKIIDMNFIIFGVFVAAILISKKNKHKKEMIAVSYYSLLSGIILLTNKSMLYFFNDINIRENMIQLFLLTLGIIMFCYTIHKTFDILEAAI